MAAMDAVSILKISNTQRLSQFLHDCVDGLIGKNTSDFHNYDSDIEWTKDDYIKARNLIQNLYRESILNKTKPSGISSLSENAQNEIQTCFELRKDEIEQAVVKEKLLENGRYSIVENLDWKLKWVLGSSKLATLREPLLQVDLHCRDQIDAPRNTVNFEMNLEQVDKLISELERVKLELESA